MELLIVHRDPEMGQALVQMIKTYTRNQSQWVTSDKEAMDWARHHQHCELLLAQLEDDGIDGLSLGSVLSEIFPRLQVLFFPNYNADERRLDVAGSKIFPEPIEGDELLGAIERAEKMPPNTADFFHVLDVLQMCCLSRRSGAIQMVRGSKNGLVFLRTGRIVHAETTAGRGPEALAEIVNWELVEFAYERNVRPPLESMTGSWDEILVDLINAEKQVNEVESQRRSA